MLNKVMGRPKDLKKRHAILEAAQELFLEFGYDGSSMEKIAKVAGVSKLTVYNHFQDKAQLFSAAIERACEERLPKQLFEIDTRHPEQILLSLGCHFLNALYSPEAIKLHLLMSSLVHSNNELVEMFFSAGPKRTHQNIQELFEKLKQLNHMKIDNSEEAAQLFISLLTDTHYDHVLWNIKPVPTPHEIEQKVHQRLNIMFKIYPLTTC